MRESAVLFPLAGAITDPRLEQHAGKALGAM